MSDLARVAEELGRKVEGLEEAAKAIAKRTGRDRRVLHWAVAGVCLDIALSIAMVFTAVELRGEQARQNETRVKVLCPLYEVFLQTDTPQRRAATPPEDLKRYDHAIAVVRQGAETLDCAFLGGGDSPHP